MSVGQGWAAPAAKVAAQWLLAAASTAAFAIPVAMEGPDADAGSWPTPAEGDGIHAMIEETWSVPVEVIDSKGAQVTQRIVATALREAGRDRYPLLLLNHGRPPDPDARLRMGRVRMAPQARYFASLGFLVVVPTRMGYGVSGGPDVENTGPCHRKRYRPGFEAGAEQVHQVIEAARARPEVDGQRIAVIGQSFGGAVSIALAARNPQGVRVVINFAGGGGGDPERHPGEPCDPEQQSRLFADYGRMARVATHWIYTTNDRFMGPYPAEWFDAYRSAGGLGHYHLMPAFGADGHQYFSRGLAAWSPLVEAALRQAELLPGDAPASVQSTP
ncbi:S9 family peptidase [Cupriavidus sp. AU9028]|uniref:alpha/beta hydrolase family protein n=1 Tax=Cupriavidus sp. AU9028 TaxID=2871157 RepID=UPI001C968550|nr:alpha/beta fold hydrolase [Cupriavidus sp. AU9028]MBY4896720.1 alpha/beta fold hydrolase [Cupriavidus sp. AU9028]